MDEYKIFFHPSAEQDSIGSFDWYANQNIDSAIAFREELDRICGLISRNPHGWQDSHSGTKKIRLRLFPFKVIYRIANERIEIIAVAHDRRRPNYWKKRLE